MPREFVPGQREPDTPSNSIPYFFREALRRLWVTRRTSFVAVAMIAISLFVVGSFVLVAENLGRAITRWEGGSRVHVYLDADVTPDQIRAVDAYLASRPDLRSRKFVSKEEALAAFKSHFENLGGVVDQLEENPLPPSFEVKVTQQAAQSAALVDETQALRRMPGVEEIDFDWEWVEQMKRIVRIVNVAGIIAGAILALAAAFTIANVIRLTMLTYREEIDIMRLVGATERIIRGPFLIEGVLQGTLGGLLALALLLGAFEAARNWVAAPSSLVWGFLLNVFLPWQKAVALVAGGMVAGWLGSWMSVREHAKEA